MNPNSPVIIPAAILVTVLFLLAIRRAGAVEPITVPALVQPLANDILIRAIRAVENWDGRSEGMHGERGPSQIKMITWRQHSDASWSHALYVTAGDRLAYHEVEFAHAAWIRDIMECRGYPQTAYTFALFWRAGEKAVKNNRLTIEERDYAERVENVYRSLRK